MKTSTHAEKATARTAAHGVSRSFVALIVAAVAAIATLLAMTCVPQASLPAAHADPTDMSSITVVNAQPRRTYKAYRFATFSDVKAADDSTVASLDVTTMSCPTDSSKEQCWNYQLKNAYTTARNENPDLLPDDWDKTYDDNPAAFMATLNGDKLATMMRYFHRPEGIGPDGWEANEDEDAHDITISGIREGWYVVVDEDDTGGVYNAVVATTITANNTTYKKFTLSGDLGQSAIAIEDALGRFYAKNENAQTAPSKDVYADPNYNDPCPSGSFSIGDKLYYKVNARISAHAKNYSDYTFVIRDEASRGLTIDESTVKLREAVPKDATMSDVPSSTDYTVELKKGTDYTVTTTTPAADKTTRMDVEITSPKGHAGNYLQLTYTATLDKAVVDDGYYTTTDPDHPDTPASKKIYANHVVNRALVYTDKQGEQGVYTNKQGWTEAASVVNFTGSVKFTKVGVDNESKGLRDAKFQVFDENDATQTPMTFTEVGKGNGVYNYDPSATNTYVTSGADGTVQLNGLRAVLTKSGDKQQYTFKETATNRSLGYAQSILATFTVSHEINGEGAVTNSLSHYKNNHLGLAYEEQNAIKVKNVKNFTQLPLTGAAGVALFTVLALVLGGSAAVLTVKYRRTRKQLDEAN